MQTVNLKLDFSLLNYATVPAYQHLTYPLWREQLLGIEKEKSMIAVGVAANSQPIGLAIAFRLPEGKKAQILSIFLKPEYRGKGIGEQLLQNLEQRLQTLGCRHLELSYLTQGRDKIALERLLTRQGWSVPRSTMLVCHSNTTIIKQASWLYSTRFPTRFEIFPLAEITKREYQIMQQEQQDSPWYPEILSPFTAKLPIDPLNSLGLRNQGRVVGWIATHRVFPDTIRYTSLFVRKDLQTRGWAIPLLARAIKLQVTSDIPRGIWTVATDNDRMMRFVKRRLQPFLTQIQESKQTYKLITN